MTSSLETEWDYSRTKERDGQKKKTGEANERKGKVNRGKDEEVNGQGGKRGALAPHGEILLVSVLLLFLKMYRLY